MTRRLRLAPDDLMAVAPADRQDSLEYQLELLCAGAHAAESST